MAMKIYTRTGDRGRTKLYGGDPVAKNDPRVEAYGTLDELNAALGVVLAQDPEDELGTAELRRIQEDLLVLGSRLAAAHPERALRKGTILPLPEERVAALETWIDRLDDELPPLDAFVLPGGCPAGAQLHVARTVCRRAERAITALIPAQPDLRAVVLPYMNRLSDLLFTLARAVNLRADHPEARWTPLRERTADAEGDDAPAAGADA
jgi:cob(I)alamin adenosyltransferase